MLRLSTACVALILAVSPTTRPEPDQIRNIIKTDSRIEFHASSTFTKIVGVFHSWQADFKMPTDNFENASLLLLIQADSIATGSHFKDKEVRGGNFFNVKRYPDIRFISTTIRPGSDPSKFLMEGDLTLRGITKLVSVAITLHPQESGRQRIDGEMSFNRRDFGMTHNMPFNRVANMVKVEMSLEVENGSSPLAQNSAANVPTNTPIFWISTPVSIHDPNRPNRGRHPT
jgi:polyisoprenoid-binding protein YceI